MSGSTEAAHNLTWLTDAPDVKQASEESSAAAKEALIQYVRGQGVQHHQPMPECEPSSPSQDNICNLSYSELEDFDQDLVDLIANCQRHTRCCCLHSRNNQHKCSFGYPNPLQPDTALVMDAVLLTAGNDGTLFSCLHGVPKWTCSTVCLVSSTVLSMPPRVNLGHSH